MGNTNNANPKEILSALALPALIAKRRVELGRWLLETEPLDANAETTAPEPSSAGRGGSPGEAA